jgi:U3 small nucleolar RNA-associated protein 21
VGPQLPQTIVGLASHRDRTFAATGQSILECIRVHRSGAYHRTKEILPGKSIVVQLLVLGDFLISLWRDGTLVIWHIGEYDSPVREIQLDQAFIPTCMAHPDTYVNKILIGSEDGRMQLWNFNTMTRLYDFSSFGSAIRCIVSSPALDVVGVGLTDG